MCKKHKAFATRSFFLCNLRRKNKKIQVARAFLECDISPHATDFSNFQVAQKVGLISTSFYKLHGQDYM